MPIPEGISNKRRLDAFYQALQPMINRKIKEICACSDEVISLVPTNMRVEYDARVGAYYQAGALIGFIETGLFLRSPRIKDNFFHLSLSLFATDKAVEVSLEGMWDRPEPGMPFPDFWRDLYRTIPISPGSSALDAMPEIEKIIEEVMEELKDKLPLFFAFMRSAENKSVSL